MVFGEGISNRENEFKILLEMINYKDMKVKKQFPDSDDVIMKGFNLWRRVLM